MNWGKWPDYRQAHYDAVSRVIRSGQLFAASEARSLECEFEEFLGHGNVAAVGNATEGLHLALAALNVGIGDEVIVSNYSWISTASAVLMQNAVPIFCDFRLDNLGINHEDIEALISPRTKALVVTHMLGMPSAIVEISKICRRHKIALIEDCSHAHGGSAGGRSLGTFGSISVFSLHQRKTVSAGDGGLVVAASVDLIEKVRRLRSFGDRELSYNYRITEFAASIARVELGLLRERTARRRASTQLFWELTKGCQSFASVIPNDQNGATYYANAVVLSEGSTKAKLKSILNWAEACGVPLRLTWEGLNRHPHFNPDFVPARGLPWTDPRYGGDAMPRYDGQKYKNSDEFLPNRILEIYFHPETPDSSVRVLANKMISIFEEQGS